MSSYSLAPQVPSDLADIWQYIAQDNPDAADRVLDALSAAFTKLAEMPGMGHRRPGLGDDRLRFWPVFTYLIVYRAETNPLEVVRVVSGYRDLAPLLLGQ